MTSADFAAQLMAAKQLSSANVRLFATVPISIKTNVALRVMSQPQPMSHDRPFRDIGACEAVAPNTTFVSGVVALNSGRQDELCRARNRTYDWRRLPAIIGIFAAASHCGGKRQLAAQNQLTQQRTQPFARRMNICSPT
jgi:hypothetical protein